MYIALLLEENFIFRSTFKVRKLHEHEFDGDYKQMYNWTNWNNPMVEHWGLQLVLHFFVDALEQLLE